MSIAPYTSFEVTDLSSNKQPYVNCTTEFGYFGNIGLQGSCNSMPTFLLTNNGIATVDASSGLRILQKGIYTLNVAIDCSATNLTTGADFSMGFNFGTTRLVNTPLTNPIDSFGQQQYSGVFSFSNNAPTYPGIISWITDDGTTGSNPTASNYDIMVVLNPYLWYLYNTNCNTDTSFKSGILTTKITFIIDRPTTIFFNTFSSGSALRMGTSYFTLKVVLLFPSGWTQLGTINNLPATANWAAIASSSDGTKLVSGVYGTIMYRSSDSGNSWTPLGTGNGLPATANWYSIASSSDGTKLAAVITAQPGTNNQGIWTSSNSGANWTQQTSGLPGNAAWHSITSSSDGSRLAAVVYGGGIWTSTDSGQNWVQRTSAGSRQWRYIASSSDGTKLAAVVFGGFIWTSFNSGADWSQQATSQNWYSIASSSDGSRLAAVVYGGGIYTSSNYGGIWTQQTLGLPTTALWHTIASSSDGSKLAAVVDDGTIYTSDLDSY